MNAELVGDEKCMKEWNGMINTNVARSSPEGKSTYVHCIP